MSLAERDAEARQMATAIQRTQSGYGVEDYLAAFRFAPDGEALIRRAAKRVGLA